MPPAARLIAERAGTDIVRLRGDLDRLLLYTAGQPTITLADVREIVSAEPSQDDWAVTNAIQQRNAPEALRQLGLALDGGAVPYMILGQLAWFVREKLGRSATHSRRGRRVVPNGPRPQEFGRRPERPAGAAGRRAVRNQMTRYPSLDDYVARTFRLR